MDVALNALLAAEDALETSVRAALPDEVRAARIMDALTEVRGALADEVEAGRLAPRPNLERDYLAVCADPFRFINADGTPKAGQTATTASANQPLAEAP